MYTCVGQNRMNAILYHILPFSLVTLSLIEPRFVAIRPQPTLTLIPWCVDFLCSQPHWTFTWEMEMGI